MNTTFKPEDITLLLQQAVKAPLVTKAEKEKLIAEGGHYSDVVVTENEPTEAQDALFESLVLNTKVEMAKGVHYLSQQILAASHRHSEIVLLSLVRAGAPMGVLLKRSLDKLTDRPVAHYGISIIRDRGIDAEALRYVLKTHPKATIFFVDGWTGKGTILNSLTATLSQNKDWNNYTGLHSKREKHPIRLVVYADPANIAWASYTKADMLIPFGILNSTVSGLISRTIYTSEGYHSVHIYENLRHIDKTNKFLDAVSEVDLEALNAKPEKWSLEAVMKATGTTDVNKIKPSICETTRAILRRVPRLILVQDKTDPDLALILELSKKEGVEVIEDKQLVNPYKAVAILD